MTDYNRKSHTRFQFVPKSVTLDKLKRFLSVATHVFTEPDTKTYQLLDFIFRHIILFVVVSKTSIRSTTLLSLVHTPHWRLYLYIVDVNGEASIGD